MPHDEVPGKNRKFSHCVGFCKTGCGTFVMRPQRGSIDPCRLVWQVNGFILVTTPHRVPSLPFPPSAAVGRGKDI